MQAVVPKVGGMVTLSNGFSFKNPAAPSSSGSSSSEGGAAAAALPPLPQQPFTVSAVKGGRVSVLEWPGWSFENPVPLKSHNGRTPLHLAAAYGHTGVVEELALSAKPAVFQRIMALKTKWEGWNCLHFACHGGHAGCVSALAAHCLGATVECLRVKDKGGLLPVQLAKAKKEGDWEGTITAIFDLLEKAEALEKEKEKQQQPPEGS